MDKDFYLLAVGSAVAMLSALVGVIYLMVKTGANKIWAEIEKLRKVRHDNLDHLTHMDAKLTLLEFKLDDLSKSMSSKYQRMKEIIKNGRSWRTDSRDDGS